MANKERNFRSAYYDKVGFRGVEEKKALEMLLNEKPIDVEKLTKFISRCSVLSVYRELVWKVILDVTPANIDQHETVLKIRTENYEFVHRSLKVMRKISDSTPTSLAHVIMYLVTEDVLLFELEKQLGSLQCKNLNSLASVFLNLFPDEVTSYWLFKMFLCQQKKYTLNIKAMKEEMEVILKKESSCLYEHLKCFSAFDIVPVDTWFGRYFAGIFDHTSLAKVLDKVIGSGPKILPFVAAAIFIVAKLPLMSVNTSDELMEVFEKMPEDASDAIVSKAFDLYDNSYSRR